jgi:hypothetical protein
MPQVLGRTDATGPTGQLGTYRARDGSDGAPVHIDLANPHAALVVGKRGSGKSYTLGVLAEELAAADGVAPVVVDPMGVFGGLEAVGGRVVDPAVRPASIPPSTWPDLLGLDPASGPGSLVWRVVADGPPSPSLAALREAIEAANAPAETRRAASNHLRLAASWGVFDADAPPMASLAVDGNPAVLDLAGAPPADSSQQQQETPERDRVQPKFAPNNLDIPAFLRRR